MATIDLPAHVRHPGAWAESEPEYVDGQWHLEALGARSLQNLAPGVRHVLPAGAWTKWTTSGGPWYPATGHGTPNEPVVLSGAVGEDGELLTTLKDMVLRIGGEYLILENLILDNARIQIRSDLWEGAHHILVRNCLSSGAPRTRGGTIYHVRGGEQFVFHKCRSTYQGFDLTATTEGDVTGFGASEYADWVWFIECDGHYHGGDGAQVEDSSSEMADHVIFHGCEFWSNQENGVDLKRVKRCLVSGCYMSGHQPTHYEHSGSDGTAFVVNDITSGLMDQRHVWIVGNAFDGNRHAVRCQGTASMIGNDVRGCDAAPVVVFGGGVVLDSAYNRFDTDPDRTWYDGNLRPTLPNGVWRMDAYGGKPAGGSDDLSLLYDRYQDDWGVPLDSALRLPGAPAPEPEPTPEPEPEPEPAPEPEPEPEPALPDGWENEQRLLKDVYYADVVVIGEGVYLEQRLEEYVSFSSASARELAQALNEAADLAETQ